MALICLRSIPMEHLKLPLRLLHQFQEKTSCMIREVRLALAVHYIMGTSDSGIIESRWSRPCCTPIFNDERSKWMHKTCPRTNISDNLILRIRITSMNYCKCQKLCNSLMKTVTNQNQNDQRFESKRLKEITKCCSERWRRRQGSSQRASSSINL